MHRARHVGVVRPAQVQVQVAVGLQGRQGVAVSAWGEQWPEKKQGPGRAQPRGGWAGRQGQGVLEEWEEGGEEAWRLTPG